MELEKVLDENIITLDIDIPNKKSVIEYLSRNLLENGYIDNEEKFIDDIYKREKQGITGIGDYIAIPHGKSDAVKKIGVAICRLKKEIEWETLDGKGVKIIFLFSVSNNNNYAKNHMILLSKFAAKLGDENVTNELFKVTDKKNFIKLFS